MPMFKYEAVDNTGKVLRGVMDAVDEQQVTSFLQLRGFKVQQVWFDSVKTKAQSSQMTQNQTNQKTQTTSYPQKTTTSGGMAGVTLASGIPVSVKSYVPARQLAVFFRQLATLVKSGVPLSQSITEIIPFIRNPKLKKLIPQIQQKLQIGQTLSSVMAEHPFIFPVHTISSIWCGELNGNLDIALEDIAVDYEQEASDTSYGLIGWAITKATMILFVFFLPMLDIQGLINPIITSETQSQSEAIRMLIKNYTQNYLPKSIAMTIILIAIWYVWGYLKRIPHIKRILDDLILKVPVWGQLHKCRANAKFLKSLDGLYSAGISPQTAWDAASLTPRNSEVAEKLNKANAYLTQSEGLSKMFEYSSAFDMEDIGLITSGEKAGKAPEILKNLANNYSTKAANLKTIGKLWSISALTTFSLILGGYGLIKMVQNYLNMALNIDKFFSQ